MRNVLSVTATLAMFAVLVTFAACLNQEAHHTVDLGGVIHAEGFNNPLVKCVECHSMDLTGGRGRSCYDCHDNADHLGLYKGVGHNKPSINCSRCHGPDNAGGLGPACTDCHAI